ncbi:MAG: S-adenosylmethionine:tRNA ribosyltransferase-isomerase, partial [Pseudomonadota bacterium]
MKVTDFDFDLPEELIAQAPLPERSASRLLMLDRLSGGYRDGRFTDLLELLEPGDVLVFNNTRVIPARLYAEKETGGRVEILIERVLESDLALGQIKANRKPPIGSVLSIDSIAGRVKVLGRVNEFWRLKLLPDTSTAG